MWNTLTKEQKIIALQSFAASLRNRTIFGIMCVTTSLVDNMDNADKLFNDIKFIQDEGYSLGMIEMQFQQELKQIAL